MEDSKLQPHIALLSSPGLGHLFPILELAKLFSTLHNFSVTVLTIASPSSPAEHQVIISAKASKLFDLVELPPVDISSLVDSSTAVVSLIAIMMRQSLPALHSAVSALNPPAAALIVDIFGTEAFPIADEFRMAKYVFVASHAWFLALTVYVPVLDEEVEGEYVDRKELLRIPGCEPIRPCDVVDPMLDRTDEQYREYVRMGVEIPQSDGVLVNTWKDLQDRTLVALRDENLLGRLMKSPVYAVGPIIRKSGSNDLKCELLNWLNDQPRESVMYVSFGSGGTLSFDQMTELALGLELSQQRFIWVVRPPTGKSDAAFFTVGGKIDDQSEASFLPDGFQTRTKKVGHVIPMWAPQTDLLSHPSVGGFLTHCGWNSTLESLTNGVPMIAWPLYAEQRMNVAMLVEEFGVAVRPRAVPSRGVVGRDEIAMVVRKVMVDEEGKAMRAKVKELKQSAEKAWGEAGSSYQELSQVANLFKHNRLA